MTPLPRISNRTASRRTAPGRSARRTLAVFDLDKTIVDTSASMAYGRPMAKRGIITTGEMLRIG
ncbi:MAG: HAD-IB family hydrolase, partial [Corynebacterium urealyticum]